MTQLDSTSSAGVTDRSGGHCRPTPTKEIMPTTHKVESSPAPEYQVTNEDAIITQALRILASRVKARQAFHAPDDVKNYLIMKNATENDQHVERFSVMFLDNKNCMISHEVLFTGTLTKSSVYPREIVRAALRNNAASVVLSHNHPSGSLQPSFSDERLTKTIKEALELVDVRVLDHVITSAEGMSLSMAEKGLI